MLCGNGKAGRGDGAAPLEVFELVSVSLDEKTKRRADAMGAVLCRGCRSGVRSEMVYSCARMPEKQRPRDKSHFYLSSEFRRDLHLWRHLKKKDKAS